MTRLSELSREELRPEDRPIYDELAGIRGGMRGPYAVLLHSPKLAQRVGATGEYLRFQSLLPPALREVVVLAVAREVGSQYVFSVHAPMARNLDVAESTIEILRSGRDFPDGSSDEAVVVRFVRELVRDRKITDAAFTAALDRFGAQGAVELVGFVGFYLAIGHVGHAFELELSPATTPVQLA